MGCFLQLFTIHSSLLTFGMGKRTDCHTSDIGHWFAMTCVIWLLYEGLTQRPHPALRATHNHGMIATGNHQYFNSLRGAPPLPGEGSLTQKTPQAKAWGAVLCQKATENYSATSVTTPEPTVRPPSRIAKRRPFSIAMGVISSTFITTLSPGMHISTPSGREMMPVTSVVRK